MMEFTFTLHGSADEENKTQARGIVAALHAIYGDAVLPYPAVTNHVVLNQVSGTGNVDLVTTPPYVATVGGTAEPTAAEIMAEPDAAAIMGGTPTPVPTGERDTAGIPWDERIHASTKGTNKDGTWSRRRNTPDELFNSVMTQLKAAQGAGLIPPPPSSAPATTAGVPLPPPVAPAVSSTAPAVPAHPGGSTFVDVMQRVTTAQGAGKISHAQIVNLLGSIGLPDIMGLHKRPDLIPSFELLFNDHMVPGPAKP